MSRVDSAAERQQAKEQVYQNLQKNAAPPRHLLRNCLNAFWTGGLICLLAQGVQSWLLTQGFNTENVGAPTSAVMIFLAVILTSCGVYDRISQFAGAGTAVPITGFANSMCSAALEYRSEGFVLGVGGNMFKVAGPVIVFGAVSAFIAAIAAALWYTLGGGAI
ncbi:MAG: stage V sporulation protein AC [Firmicutes bacterium]|nr:stage V sporulation protein AC [Bacillota bacterium]